MPMSVAWWNVLEPFSAILVYLGFHFNIKSTRFLSQIFVPKDFDHGGGGEL